MGRKRLINEVDEPTDNARANPIQSELQVRNGGKFFRPLNK